MKLLKLLIQLRYRALMAWLSLKWCFQTTLGDRVRYQGREWTVINGVVCNQWSLWDASQNERVEAQCAHCVKVWSIRGMVRSFGSGWRFYRGYWFDIWCREGIQAWMRALPIWGHPR